MRKSARSCTKVDTASKVPALSKSVQVIDAIISHGPITIPQLIEVTGISRSSTYTLVGEMERLGLIHQDRFGRLVLWLKLISIGTMASRSFSLAEAVHPYLERLITHTPCIAAYFGMMSDGQGSYITKLTSKRTQIVAKSKVGEIVDLVHSGLGKCLLAFSDQDFIETRVPELDYTPLTPSSILTPEALLAQLTQIREQGYALNDSEDDPEIRSLAAPVLGQNGELFGAVSVVGTLNSFKYEVLLNIATQLKLVATDLSASLR